MGAENSGSGNRQSTVSFLEFGSIDLEKGSKAVWDFRLDDKAYEWFMLARYMNDLTAYEDMCAALSQGQGGIEQAAKIYKKEVHHPDDASLNLSKLCALSTAASMEKASFFELGQTLFGCIEGMAFIQRLFEHLEISLFRLDLKNVRWFGVDISDLFNRVSAKLHTGYSVQTWGDLSCCTEQTDVFFAKGVTLLYAVESASQMIRMLKQGRCAVFDYSFSLCGEQRTTIGTGKSVTYLDYYDFLRESIGCGRRYYVRRDKCRCDRITKRIFVDGLFAEEDVCRKFIAADSDARHKLAAVEKHKPAMSLFCDLTGSGMLDWILLDDYIKSL